MSCPHGERRQTATNTEQPDDDNDRKRIKGEKVEDEDREEAATGAQVECGREPDRCPDESF